jgi:hypothetical protein
MLGARGWGSSSRRIGEKAFTSGTIEHLRVEIVPTFVGFRRSDRQTFENAFERIEAIADDCRPWAATSSW